MIFTYAAVSSRGKALALIDIDLTTKAEVSKAQAENGVWYVPKKVLLTTGQEIITEWLRNGKVKDSKQIKGWKSVRLATDQDIAPKIIVCRVPNSRTDTGIYKHSFWGNTDLSENPY